MATIDSPTQPGVSVEVESTFRAMRTVVRPLDYIGQSNGGTTLVGGHYAVSGTIAPQAWVGGALLWGFRHVNPNLVSIILRLGVLVTTATAITAQRIDPVSCQIARGYTAAETTNAQAFLNPGTGTNKARTSMAPLTVLTQSTTAAAGMSGGTRSLDTANYTKIKLSGLAALGSSDGGDLLKVDRLGGHPVVLTANEGILINWGATTLATGTAALDLYYEWAEVPVF